MFGGMRKGMMTNRRIPLLTKSRFVSGLQCLKMIHLDWYKNGTPSPVTQAQQFIFDQGDRVGVLAQQRFPGGVLVDVAYYAREEAEEETQRLLADASVNVLYEASFRSHDVHVRCDILERHGDGTFGLIEVKSSTSAKSQYLPDIAVQLWVLEGAGLAVSTAHLLHINREYVYPGGEYALDELFNLVDVTEEARSVITDGLPQDAESMLRVLSDPETPDIPVGRHCKKPYTCAYYDHCHVGLPDHSVAQLPRAGEALLDKLDAAGIKDIREIPDDFEGLSASQQRVRDTLVGGESYVGAELARALGSVEYPLFFLDFETFNPGLPLFPGTRPYDLVLFQWSLHVRTDAGSEETHAGFLAEGEEDPRGEFLKSLLEQIGPEGSIVVYSAFEASRLRELAVLYPEHAGAIEGVISRIVDLLTIVRDHVYHADFHGSYSLKAVLPALVPDLNYGDLEVQEGGGASATFFAMRLLDPPSSERQTRYEALWEYCKRDTLAMVRVFDALGELK